MTITKAKYDDLEMIIPIYDYARSFMTDNGNPNQWIDGYPSREIIAEDINNDSFYVCKNEEESIVGAFTFIIGNDPTYENIYSGKWLNDKTYGVIHRLVSNGTTHGITKNCIEWCLKQIQNIRIDTHADNKIMQSLILKIGFEYCGIIHTHNGTERLAYQISGV
ncbi:MAG: GNAT family N-acetyltransferase [Prevotella sp.]|jgi:hypothetical protein|nr:GNAT family N-acetyltransferase [Prevotella sp.]MCI1731321.1 GNAT family N-acetyltransferase [Prevotella sp.]